MLKEIPKAILLIAWLAALGVLAALSMYYTGESSKFFGIADDQEQTIRFTTPVEIVSYGFVAGQEVDEGDLIVAVRQPELVAELEIIRERSQALKFGNRESRASMESEIVQLESDRQAQLSELDSQIRNLKARQDAAASILTGLGTNGSYAGDPALGQEIGSLQVRKRALNRSIAARIDDLNSRLANSERPVDAQIAELAQRRRDLERQQTEQTVYAKLSGQVGSVLFKVGEMVPPYQPVLTVHGTRPTFIKGYIHENVVNGVTLGQTVWVQSSNATRGNVWFEGIVESLGSRIVEFPLRLKVNPLAQAWGREVVIQLNDEHALLLGEKVSVQLDRPISLFADTQALLAGVFE